MIAAFAALYILWGSTYLAIRVGVEDFPPALFASVRFLISGPTLLVLALWGGARLPNSSREYTSCAITGLFLLLGGNGGVVWASQYVPSGLSSLIIATTPFWMAGIERFWKRGERLGWLGISGIVIGFLGVICLMGPDLQEHFLHPENGGMRLVGEIVLIAAAILWAFGSIYGKHARMPENTLMTTALQMIFGGFGLAAAGLFRGEFAAFDVSAVSEKTFLALAYLIVFGSCIGFTAYTWLIKNVPAAKVSTYAYVNPLVAVFLGWALLDEKIDWITGIGMTVILFGVIMVSRDKIRIKK